MPCQGFRHPDLTPPAPRSAVAATSAPASCASRKEATMVPLLLWILGVPGLIIILLLLLGVINI
jgi:hypothetical protein